VRLPALGAVPLPAPGLPALGGVCRNWF
jgi:hypothetical protein